MVQYDNILTAVALFRRLLSISIFNERIDIFNFQCVCVRVDFLFISCHQITNQIKKFNLKLKVLDCRVFRLIN